MECLIRFLLSVGLLIFGAAPVAADDKAPPRLKPVNLEKLNTDKDEDDPHVIGSGTVLIYTSSEKGRSEVLYSERRPADKTWAKGKPLVELQGKADNRSVFLTPDGRYPQHLYYATNKDPEKKDLRGDNFDIYFFTKQFPKADFTNATPLHVCTALDEMHPWLTPDGKQLFFSRKEKTGWRLYVTRKPPDGGQFGKEALIDLPAGFHHATLAANGKTMFLQGPLEKERWGLFRTSLTNAGWSKPEPLTELNDPAAPSGDRSPCLSRDGTQLFFASDRAGGKGGLDLYVIPTSQLGKK